MSRFIPAIVDGYNDAHWPCDCPHCEMVWETESVRVEQQEEGIEIRPDGVGGAILRFQSSSLSGLITLNCHELWDLIESLRAEQLPWHIDSIKE